MKQTTVYFFLIFFSVLFLAPFFWMLSTAVKPETELFVYPPEWIPSIFSWENFSNAWTAQPFTLFLKNSLIVVILSTFGQMFSSALIAFGFARFDFKGRNFLFMIVLGTMMIPWDVTMIPLYIEFNAFGWINTLKPLIVPSFFGAPFFIFLLRQFIMSIPKELDEAARMDGANSWQIFWKIHIPLMIPALILVGTFQFINSWNDYLGPLIFLNDQSLYTLTLGLAQFKGLHETDITSIMAITSIICIPPLLLFFFAQKYIMEGTTSAAVKG